MAEGDTVLRIATAIDAALAGQRIAAAAPDPRGAAVAQRLDGRRLDAARAHGKNLLVEFGDLVLHSHLGMGGSWQLRRRGGAWDGPKRPAWLVLSGDELETGQFGGPTLRLLRTESVRRDRVLGRLGPDILAADVDPEAIAHRLRSQGDRGIGDALLDQTLVAGIGNIFKSEACFAARINPWTAAGELTSEGVTQVARAARQLMLDAVATGRHAHSVYRRAGRPCPRCGAPIAARGQGDANRTTYWCPNCQV